jgi:hypothetical protein
MAPLAEEPLKTTICPVTSSEPSPTSSSTTIIAATIIGIGYLVATNVA